MFNVWLPAVLESKAEGEGDAAIKYALQEMVMYAAAGTPGSIVSRPRLKLSLLNADTPAWRMDDPDSTWQTQVTRHYDARDRPIDIRVHQGPVKRGGRRQLDADFDDCDGHVCGPL